MDFRLKWYILLVLPILFACAESERLNGPGERDQADEICGIWVWQSVIGDTTILRLTDKLDTDRYGLVFHTDGYLIERKNAGWCGTPPITYTNFDGTWERTSSAMLDIEVGYWGGTMTYQLEIIELSDSILRVLYRDTNLNFDS